MAQKHAVHVHVTKCTTDNKFKVFVVIPVGAGADIPTSKPPTVSEPDNNGLVKISIKLDANASAADSFIERAFMVDANARFIQIDLNGQYTYRPYIGCNIDLDKYINEGFDPCPNGDVACDVPYIASIPYSDETIHQLEILIKNCANSYIIPSQEEKEEEKEDEPEKSVKVVLAKVALVTTGWQNIAIGGVSGATTDDDYSAEVTGDPTKKNKTKIPITGHKVNPRKSPRQQS
jgi:hypothetical protein